MSAGGKRLCLYRRTRVLFLDKAVSAILNHIMNTEASLLSKSNYHVPGKKLKKYFPVFIKWKPSRETNHKIRSAGIISFNAADNLHANIFATYYFTI